MYKYKSTDVHKGVGMWV